MKKFVLFFSLFIWGVLALHAEDIKVGNIKYKVTSNNTVTLIDGKKAEGSFTIPEEIENKKGQKFTVTSIGKEAFKGSNIASIVIPNTITSISEASFKECKNLKSISLPTAVTEIPMQAFEKCGNLVSYSIPGVKIIGKEAFKECKSLKEIIIPANVNQIEYDAFEKTNAQKIKINYSPEILEVNSYNIVGWNPSLEILDVDRNWNSSMITDQAKQIILGEHVTEMPTKIGNWFNMISKVQKITLNNSNWINQFTIIANAMMYSKVTDKAPSIQFEIPGHGLMDFNSAYHLIRNQKQEQEKINDLMTRADKGSPEAIVDLINYYNKEQNYSEAVKYIKKLIDLESPSKLKLLSTSDYGNPGTSNAYQAFQCCIATENKNLAFLLFENLDFSKNEKEMLIKDYPELKFEENGMLFDFYENGIILVKYEGNDKKVVIPSKVKDHKGKERPVIAIKSECFNNCDLTSIEIPSSIVNIQREAFYKCPNLAKVTINNDKEINFDPIAFYGCDEIKWANIDYPYFKSNEFNSDFNKAIKNIFFGFDIDVTLEYVSKWVALHNANQCYQAAEQATLKSNLNNYNTDLYDIKFLLLQKAVTNGNTDAQLSLCKTYCFIIDKNTVAESFKKKAKYEKTFFKVAQALANKGIPMGYYCLGVAYESGHGVSKSRSMAHSNYAKARDKGISCEKEWRRTR